MCTLTLFRKPTGYSVFMNRDERHDRAKEHPPQILRTTYKVFGPLDPQSNGTWVAYNEIGFWGCLLNGYFEDSRITNSTAKTKSRGDILPNLLSQDDPIAAAHTMDTSPYNSFRLLIGSASTHLLKTWDGKQYTETPFHDSYDDRIFFLSSSSWEQETVIKARKALFREWIKTSEHNNHQHIPRFHYLQDPTPESAPFMMRSYSGTKSITSMQIEKNNIVMSYLKSSDILSRDTTMMERQSA